VVFITGHVDMRQHKYQCNSHIVSTDSSGKRSYMTVQGQFQQKVIRSDLGDGNLDCDLRIGWMGFPTTVLGRRESCWC
jgi:hypothetical protein